MPPVLGDLRTYSLPTEEIGIHDSPFTIHPYTRCQFVTGQGVVTNTGALGCCRNAPYINLLKN